MNISDCMDKHDLSWREIGNRLQQNGIASTRKAARKTTASKKAAPPIIAKTKKAPTDNYSDVNTTKTLNMNISDCMDKHDLSWREIGNRLQQNGIASTRKAARKTTASKKAAPPIIAK